MPAKAKPMLGSTAVALQGQQQVSTISKLEKALKRSEGRADDAEWGLETASNKSRDVLMTLAGDGLEMAGAAAAGKICAAFGDTGTKLCIALGVAAQVVRPFTDMGGHGRLATATPFGIGNGGLAIATYNSSIKRQATSVAA